MRSSMVDLEALVTSGPFRGVWIFDFSKKRVLWHLSAEATYTLPVAEAEESW
jgi:hypothetical protein